MIEYLDSSALVKRYVEEPGTSLVARLFAGDAILVVSAIAWAECLAALTRKSHDGTLSKRAYLRVRDAFVAEWKSLHEIGVTREVRDIALEILDRVPVRGIDAIHLASARWAERNLKAPVRFWCADQRLSEAATEIGLQVQNPEATEV